MRITSLPATSGRDIIQVIIEPNVKMQRTSVSLGIVHVETSFFAAGIEPATSWLQVGHQLDACRRSRLLNPVGCQSSLCSLSSLSVNLVVSRALLRICMTELQDWFWKKCKWYSIEDYWWRHNVCSRHVVDMFLSNFYPLDLSSVFGNQFY